MVRDRESGQAMLNACPLSPGPCRSQGQAPFLYHSLLPAPFLFLLTPPACPNAHCLFIPRSCVLSAPCCQLTSSTLILAHFFFFKRGKQPLLKRKANYRRRQQVVLSSSWRKAFETGRQEVGIPLCTLICQDSRVDDHPLKIKKNE